MFTKTLKQLWDEVEAKAEQLYIDIESPEFKLLKAMAERCHKIEVELGFVLEDHAPGAGIQTATDLALAAAGQIAPADGDPAAPAAGENAKEPVWDGKRHI